MFKINYRGVLINEVYLFKECITDSFCCFVFLHELASKKKKAQLLLLKF